EYFPIIITDLRMPGMDGLELISKIMILSPRSRVILITAFGDNHIREEAFKKGIFDYLTKPVKKEDILAVVGRAVGLYQNC
ncbi:MAG: response regulator, partial [Candidatus Aenigmatarchaeota archaeon]